MSDKNIGETFKTKRGNIVRIVGVVNLSKRGTKYYKVFCEDCKEYHEVQKGLLTRGHTPCSCGGKGKRYTLKTLEMGSRFGCLTVSHRLSCGKYVVSCDICSADKELFRDVDMVITKGHLLRGSKPCGCSGNTKWSDYQSNLRVEREILAAGFTGRLVSKGGSRRKDNYQIFNPDTGVSWFCSRESLLSTNNLSDPSTRSSNMIGGFPDTPHIPDNLYVMLFLKSDGTEYIKVGEEF